MYTGTFGPASNRAAWYEQIDIAPGDTEAPTVTEIVLTFGGGKACKVTRRLSSSEITYSDGVITYTVPESVMHNFCAGSYDMGISLTISDVPVQLFAGKLEIIDGVVP